MDYNQGDFTDNESWGEDTLFGSIVCTTVKIPSRVLALTCFHVFFLPFVKLLVV